MLSFFPVPRWTRLVFGQLNSFHANCLPTTFANKLDPDQGRQSVGPDLDPNCLTLKVFLKEFLDMVKKKE